MWGKKNVILTMKRKTKIKVELSRQILDDIDLERYKEYDLDIGNEYFYLWPGREHYRILAHFSNVFSGKTFLDVGTNHGCSALALAYNKENDVVSFDVVDNKKESFSNEENIKFEIGDAIELAKKEKPFLVFLDASKNDGFEQKFVEEVILPYVEKNDCILVLDDYNEYPIVQELVRNLEKKYSVHDLTQYGHYSGTHLVDFNNILNIVKK